MYNIELEDLVSNAFIEANKNKKTDFLSYQTIEKYGNEVVKVLENKAKLLLNRNRTFDMLTKHNKYYCEELQTKSNTVGIRLKSGITIDELIERFRGYLPLELLLAFVNKQATSVLI